jgi:protocatechuate 3,4-dioxygenase beta subunit
MALRLLVSSLLAVTLSVAARPQTPRDQAREPTGHAVLAEKVTDDAGGAGLRRVDLTLTGGSLVGPRKTLTDESGRFSFDNLAAGTYRVRANRQGLVTTEYGASKAGRPGLSVVLADTDRREIVISMPRAAAIGGTVFDETGAPLPNARVTALRAQMKNGVRVYLDTLSFADSDEGGGFRIPNLDAGQYVVEAGRLDFNRRQPDFTRMAEGEVDLALREPAVPVPAAPVTHRNFGFAPVYYPSATSSTSATPLSVSRGQELTGINLTLGVTPVARIEGIVTGADGRPAANAQVTLLPRNAVDSILASQYAPGGLLVPRRTDAAGHFAFAGVQPDDYTVSVRTAGPVAEWAAIDIATTGDDQMLTLTTRPARTLTGRLIFDGASAPPADLTNTRVQFNMARAPSVVNGYEATAHVAADGRLTISGVVPGSYWLTATAPGATSTSGWALTSALVEGREALDGPIDVSGESDITDVALHFTDHPSGVAGTLQTAAGLPASDYFVVVFSKDLSYWKPGSRRIAMARPNSSGAFNVRNLPPGEYLIAALTDVEDGEWFDKDFLSQLVPAARTFTIETGQVAREDLRIGG